MSPCVLLRCRRAETACPGRLRAVSAEFSGQSAAMARRHAAQAEEMPHPAAGLDAVRAPPRWEFAAHVVSCERRHSVLTMRRGDRLDAGVLEAERSTAAVFQPLPFRYLEVAHVLLTDAKDSFVADEYYKVVH